MVGSGHRHEFSALTVSRAGVFRPPPANPRSAGGSRFFVAARERTGAQGLMVVWPHSWTTRTFCRTRSSTGAATGAEVTPHHLRLDTIHVSSIIGCMIDALI